jgi:hypothetical protein
VNKAFDLGGVAAAVASCPSWTAGEGAGRLWQWAPPVISSQPVFSVFRATSSECDGEIPCLSAYYCTE